MKLIFGMIKTGSPLHIYYSHKRASHQHNMDPNWRRGKQQEQDEHATNNLYLLKSYKYLTEGGKK